MSLKFPCPHCGAAIVVQYLKAGESCKCRACGRECTVPETAEQTAEVSTTVGRRDIPPAPPSTAPIGSPRLACRGTRLGAALIDGLTYVVPYIFIVIGIGQESVGLMLFGFLGILAIMVVQMVLLSIHGQTIGKKAVDIKIVKYDTGKNGGFVTNVLLRAIVNGIIGIIPFYGLVDISFIFGEERRCIHDLIAGTRVVECSAETEAGTAGAVSPGILQLTCPYCGGQVQLDEQEKIDRRYNCPFCKEIVTF